MYPFHRRRCPFSRRPVSCPTFLLKAVLRLGLLSTARGPLRFLQIEGRFCFASACRLVTAFCIRRLTTVSLCQTRPKVL